MSQETGSPNAVQQEAALAGRALQRFKDARKRAKCARSRMDRLASDYSRTAEAIRKRLVLNVHRGEIRSENTHWDPPVRLWGIEDVHEAFEELASAEAEFESATADWEKYAP